jgi:hypothetical protein
MSHRKSLQQLAGAAMLFAGLALMASLVVGCGAPEVVYVVASATATPWVITVVVTPNPLHKAATPRPVVATPASPPPTPTSTSPSADTPAPAATEPAANTPTVDLTPLLP